MRLLERGVLGCCLKKVEAGICDASVVELAWFVVEQIDLKVFSNASDSLCLPILVLLLIAVSWHRTSGLRLLGRQTPGTCKLLPTSMTRQRFYFSCLDLGFAGYSISEA